MHGVTMNVLELLTAKTKRTKMEIHHFSWQTAKTTQSFPSLWQWSVTQPTQTAESCGGLRLAGKSLAHQTNGRQRNSEKESQNLTRLIILEGGLRMHSKPSLMPQERKENASVMPSQQGAHLSPQTRMVTGKPKDANSTASLGRRKSRETVQHTGVEPTVTTCFPRNAEAVQAKII